MESLRVRERAVAKQYMDKFKSAPGAESRGHAGKFLSSLALQLPTETLDKIAQARMDLYQAALDKDQPISDWNAFVSEVLKRSGVTLPGQQPISEG